MRIAANGNVGIGTTSPGLSGSGRTALTLNDSSLSIFELAVGGSLSGYVYTNSSIMTMTASGSRPLTFETGGGERMRITSGGTVLVGQSSSIGLNPIFQIAGGVQLSASMGANASAPAFDWWNTNSSGSNIARFDVSTGTNIYEGIFRFFTKDAGGTLGERMRITSGGNVGIGTTSPAYKLEVNSSSADNHIAAIGTAPSINVSSSNSGPANWGTVAMATATNNFLTGSAAGDFILLNRGTTAGNILFGFGSAEKMRLTSNGDLCINATATTASAKLYVNGTAAFGSVYVASLGTGTVYSNAGTLTNTNPSDRRLKTNIIPLTYGLSDILKLNPVSYNWKDGTNGKQFGFIAQEVQEIMPDAVKDGEYLGLEKDAIYSALVNAIKELKQELDNLKNK